MYFLISKHLGISLGTGFPGGSVVKNPPVDAGDTRGMNGFSPWVRQIPWRRKWLLTLVFLPRESHGQRSLEGYSPGDRKESDMTERQSMYVLRAVMRIK